MLNRRALLITPFALGACAMLPEDASRPPILFVHGNGDSAALWHTTIWRFESNGWPRTRLSALDFPKPLARSDNTVAQDNRSSTQEQTEFLAARVDDLLAASGARKVVLVGSSRGGNPIRDFIKNRGGSAKVSHAILCGTPNHGVRVGPEGINNEFNGAGPFLTQLNAGPNEVVDGVAFQTIRSDNNDKFAQPEGRFIGRAGQQTGVSFDGPALKGALDTVLPGLDHREVAFHPKAFQAMYKFVTGTEPRAVEVTAESAPVLDGLVSSYANGAPTNLPLLNAVVEVYKIDPQTGARVGPPALRKTIGDDGRWGPFTADPTAYYEFVVTAPGLPTNHIYRSPFPRSTRYVNLRPTPFEKDDKALGDVVAITRPRGYFGHGRDIFTIDGRVPPGINEGVPGASQGRLGFSGAQRPIVTVFNTERIVVRAWPVAQDHLTFAEFHD
jgi:triacylglycerol lipase